MKRRMSGRDGECRGGDEDLHGADIVGLINNVLETFECWILQYVIVQLVSIYEAQASALIHVLRDFSLNQAIGPISMGP